MRPARLLLAACTFLLTGASPASAGRITITIATTAELVANRLETRIGIRNSGDESARSVAPVLYFREAEARGRGRPALAPGESFEESVSVVAGDIRAGRWPYRVTVDYTDVNQYPFQALQIATVSAGNPPPPGLAIVAVDAAPMFGSGRVRLRIRNLSGMPRIAAPRMVVPAGLEISETLAPVRLSGWEERTLSAAAVNRTALAESRYPVYAIAEYDDGTVHQTIVAQGQIEITAAGFFRTHRIAFWIMAAGVAAVWAVRLSVRAMMRRSSER